MGGGAYPGRGGLLWPAPSFGGWIWLWPAPLSHRPTLQRFWVQGDSPCTSLVRNAGLVEARALLQRGAGLVALLCCPLCLPTFLETGGHAVPPAGAASSTGERGFCCGLRPPSAGVRLGPAAMPHASPSNAFGIQGDSPCTPGGSNAPCALRGGNESLVVACDLLQRGLAWSRCYAARFALQRSWVQGESLYLRRGLRPLHPSWGTEEALFCHMARWDAS